MRRRAPTATSPTSSTTAVAPTNNGTRHVPRVCPHTLDRDRDDQRHHARHRREVTGEVPTDRRTTRRRAGARPRTPGSAATASCGMTRRRAHHTPSATSASTKTQNTTIPRTGWIVQPLPQRPPHVERPARDRARDLRQRLRARTAAPARAVRGVAARGDRRAELHRAPDPPRRDHHRARDRARHQQPARPAPELQPAEQQRPAARVDAREHREPGDDPGDHRAPGAAGVVGPDPRRHQRDRAEDGQRRLEPAERHRHRHRRHRPQRSRGHRGDAAGEAVRHPREHRRW